MMSARGPWLGAALGFALAACAPPIDVQTAVRPETDLRPYRSFSILVPPPPRDGRTLDRDDPMLASSPSNHELRNAIASGLWNRGYWRDERSPDLLVAYYAAATQPLDLTQWNYGYGTRPRWWSGCKPGSEDAGGALEYQAGTIIIDILDARNGEVLWRGCGVAARVDDVAAYRHDLAETVRGILDEFPLATTVVARGPRLGPVRRGFSVASASSR
jgi:hypothetical protein